MSEDITESYIEEVYIPSVTKVTTEIKCKSPRKVDYFDGYTDAVPPNNPDDILIITSGVVKDSAEMMLQRTRRNDMRIIYISIIILNILFLISAIAGVNSNWYKNLKTDAPNPYLIGSLWVIAAILSYGSLFMLWEHVKPEQISKDIQLSVYFLIGAFLSILWAGVFFQGNNLRASAWLAALLFLFEFWLLIHIWKIKLIAGLFMLPIVIMYGYFLYASIHVAAINNEPI